MDPISIERSKTATANHPLQRSQDFWYEDGTVIIQAESTIFRAYMGILSENSSVFADMFAVPQPADAEKYEGLPFVRLPDSAEDVGTFLRALHTYCYYENIPGQTFNVWSSLLRMGTKYDVPHIRERIISLLKPYCPDTQLSWTNRVTMPPDLVHRYPILLRLAKECNVPTFMPAAMLSIASLPLQSILEGVHAGVVLDVTEQEKYACFLGRTRIMERWRKLVLPSALSHRVFCQSVFRCDAARTEWLRDDGEVWNHMVDEWNDPFTAKFKIGNSVCSACSSRFTKGIADGQDNLWTNLPTYFGLPTWSELRRLG